MAGAKGHPGFCTLLFLVLSLLLPGGSVQARDAGSYAAALDSLAAWHHQSRPDRVDSFLVAELENIRHTGDRDLLRRVLLTGGTTRAAFGMARKAEPDLREACDLARAAGDTTSLLQGIRWLAVAVGRQGRAAEATGLYEQLDTLAAAVGDSIHLGWAQLGMAYDHYLAGRSREAIAGYGRAAGILDRQGIARGALWAYNGQGLALRQEGSYQQAITCFRRSVQLARQQSDPLNEAMALNYLGRLELMFGDPEQAIGHLQEAARIHADRQHHREGLLPLLDIAQARTQQGWFSQADSLLAAVKIEALHWGLEDLELLAVGYRADLRLAQGRPAGAAELCAQALQRSVFPSAMAATELRLRWADAWAQQDSFGRALETLQPDLQAAPAAHSLQLRVLVQAARYARARGLPEQALALADRGISLADQAGAPQFQVPLLSVRGLACYQLGRTDEAWDAVTRGLDRWETDRVIPADPRWRERRSAGSRQLFALGLDLARTRSDSTAFNLLQRYKARTLFERMSGPGKTHPEAIPALTLAHLQDRILSPGQVLIDVFEGPETSLLFLVTPDTCLVAGLPDNRQRRHQIRRLREALDSPVVNDPAVVRERAWRAWNLPPEFTRALARCGHLIWCPDGFWHRLPLSLLRGERGYPEDLLITRIPAAIFLEDTRQTVAQGKRAGILTMAGPPPAEGVPWSGSAFEAAWLEKTFRQVGSLSSTSLATLEETLPPGAILHLAAHTEVDGQQPWNTALLLGPRPEGRLRAEQVAGQNLPAGLVVLSSCRSAGTSIMLGEGLQGMTSGFLAAGATSVLATLWPVDDRATALFIRDFYLSLGQGRSVAEACRAAQKIRSQDPETADPRHWAGFVVVGDGQVRPDPERKPNRRIWAFPLALLAVVCLWRGRSQSRA